ncbi:cation:proton antiporter [Cellulomonas sp. SG140]|uniref:cation:proton antiporter n=1 Tax=Cellulomonas sp. SG140 TaxID=2976536 RepID=UPI0021E90856|nr:cation:proton antiporter [Cellulomonas sp. SG140]HEX3005424.1 cation:proton antiporter [Angustibacter sp.]
MTAVWAQAGVWLALALLASVISVWLRLATALSEIAVGMVAQLLIGAALGASALSRDASWVTFLSGTGAIVLTFLAGAELDPASFRSNWRQAAGIGLVSFAAPFLGCAALAIWVLGWSPRAGWLAGISMSTTSVAVVYAVMLEFGLNKTSYGKTVLAACFVTDLATVLALGLMFSPFTWRTGVFAAVAALVVVVLPRVVRAVFARFGGRPSEIEAKFLLAVLFGLAALATWAGSESVLPAYLVGMVLAGVVGRDHELVRRLRTLTFGLLTPFYFLRAGSLVSLPALAAAPIAFLALLGAKVLLKVVGVYPVTRAFRSPRREGAYTTLLMSTGLTFGTIAALFGLNHQIVSTAQYSILVAAVVGSAVIPTVIANAFFLPRHLLPDRTEVTRDVAGAPADPAASPEVDLVQEER